MLSDKFLVLLLTASKSLCYLILSFEKFYKKICVKIFKVQK